MTPLILASTSPYRRQLLERLGWPFQAQAPRFNEETAKREAPTEPSAHALALARGKAKSLVTPGQIVIGGDQLVAFEGQILGKPHTSEKALAQLMQMRGKTHQLLTAVSVWGPRGQEKTWIHRTQMSMRALSENQLREYVRRDQPLDAAGSYKFETQGLLLFEKIDCDDFSAIQGLPLLELSRVLIEFGLIPFEGAQN